MSLLAELHVTGWRLHLGAQALTQTDATTCGATAVIAARLLLGDTRLASALAGRPTSSLLAAASMGSAREPGGAAPTAASGDVGGADRGGGTAVDRAVPGPGNLLAAGQRSLQAHMNRRASGPLGPLPWTCRLGSTPWAMASAMSTAVARTRPGAGRYGVGWVDDRGSAWPGTVTALRAHLNDGVPVVLLTGGPLARRRPDDSRLLGAVRDLLAQAPAIPRHYVVAVPSALIDRSDPGWGCAHVYDPSTAEVRVLDLLAPRAPGGPGPRVLGSWPRVLAVIAPEKTPHD